MTKLCNRLAVLPLLLSAACVGSSKSSNPLSPTVAGPIAGVDITAPLVVAPAVDALVDTNTQPITLQVGNAQTTGVRPLSLRFEIATDPSFANTVFTKDSVPQDASGRTSMTLPSPLTPERKYFWHARAQDGANSGPFGATSAFNVFTPVVFGAPTLISPINDATTSSQQPRFIVGNANHTGPVTSVIYYIEIATSGSFAQLSASYSFPESANQSDLTIPVALAGGQYFWRAYATDGGHNGPYSGIQSFHTPAGGGGGGGGGGGPFNANGNWQNCGSAPGGDIVACVNSAINPPHTVDGAFEITKRVAWLLRNSGGRLLIKNGGENVSVWNGMSFSAGRVCYPGPGGAGQIYKILTDVPTTNGPTWSDNGTVDPALCVAAMQP